MLSGARGASTSAVARFGGAELAEEAVGHELQEIDRREENDVGGDEPGLVELERQQIDRRRRAAGMGDVLVKPASAPQLAPSQAFGGRAGASRPPPSR